MWALLLYYFFKEIAMMTVKLLRELLEKLPDDAEVNIYNVHRCNPEANEFETTDLIHLSYMEHEMEDDTICKEVDLLYIDFPDDSDTNKKGEKVNEQGMTEEQVWEYLRDGNNGGLLEIDTLDEDEPEEPKIDRIEEKFI